MKVPRVTMVEATSEALRELIMSGELPIGSKLRQDELADRLGVSRTPLREAIARLTLEGLVETSAHRTAVVAKPSLHELRESYEIRIELECLAGRLATERRTSETIADLEELFEELEKAEPAHEWAELNSRFHERMYEASGRSLLSQMIAQMRNRTEMFVRIFVTSGFSRTAQEDHRRILEAFKEGDPQGVEAAIREHLTATLVEVSKILAESHDELSGQQRGDDHRRVRPRGAQPAPHASPTGRPSRTQEKR